MTRFNAILSALARMAALSLALLLGSCTYKDLCYTHPHTALVSIDVDWSYSRYAHFDEGELPTGMTAVAFNREGGRPVVASTNNINTIGLMLVKGSYDIVLFNYSYDEFGSMEFEGRDAYAALTAMTVVTRSPWYMKAYPESELTRTPEWLAVARCEGLEVTEEMVRATQSRSRSRANVKTRAELPETTVRREDGSLLMTPLSATRKCRVRVNVNGYHNLYSARSVVWGFSRGYILGLGANTQEPTGNLMGKWTPWENPTDYRKGSISTVFQLFGLPDGYEGVPPDAVTLYLECLLVDGKTIKTFEFPVGDLIKKYYVDPIEGTAEDVDLEIEVEVTLPDVPHEGASSGGFGIDVEDWDDEIVTPVPVE